tara:strand:+ start:143 stop:295 length:153 start_codon:yes stop_codon:yes gene_type:complete
MSFKKLKISLELENPDELNDFLIILNNSNHIKLSRDLKRIVQIAKEAQKR